MRDIYGGRGITAKVILFKPSGMFHAEEQWEIPTWDNFWIPNDGTAERPKALNIFATGACMIYSRDYRRIRGGKVLVPSQIPWSRPHLL